MLTDQIKSQIFENEEMTILEFINLVADGDIYTAREEITETIENYPENPTSEEENEISILMRIDDTLEMFEKVMDDFGCDEVILGTFLDNIMCQPY